MWRHLIPKVPKVLSRSQDATSGSVTSPSSQIDTTIDPTSHIYRSRTPCAEHNPRSAHTESSRVSWEKRRGIVSKVQLDDYALSHRYGSGMMSEDTQSPASSSRPLRPLFDEDSPTLTSFGFDQDLAERFVGTPLTDLDELPETHQASADPYKPSNQFEYPERSHDLETYIEGLQYSWEYFLQALETQDIVVSGSMPDRNAAGSTQYQDPRSSIPGTVGTIPSELSSEGPRPARASRDDASFSSSEADASERATELCDGRLSYAICGLLGKGGCGRVYQAKTRIVDLGLQEAPPYVAIKVYDKAVLRRDEESYDNLLVEIECLKRVTNKNVPFVTHMISTFHDKEFVYIVMNLYGEDLANTMIDVGRRMPLWEIRLYAAELWTHSSGFTHLQILAIEALHKLGIVHRDIKPENIFLTGNGHIGLADFSIAAVPKIPMYYWETALLRGAVGTPCRLAPELLNNKPVYNYKLDIWLYGLTLMDLFQGRQDGEPYFRDLNGDEGVHDVMTRNINDDIRLYVDTKEARSLLRRLLNRDPYQRATIAEIKAHPFFSPINWNICRAGGYETMHRPRRPKETDETRIVPEYVSDNGRRRRRMVAKMSFETWACSPSRLLVDEHIMGEWKADGRPAPAREKFRAHTEIMQ
ncbi:kinase-like protein [Artomyces pyxidatus]|uniref:Kinase-like protein n=1 Tax=Artomyces pyxidatus TaxID=48021 RepID=A0ACB8T1P5_9AGAM|nr:kinase-like protein [Artomyces pyxidatus]